jgi:murein DD-endopeptidase MepM/ murein hydrolase activator NlpD
LKPRAETTRSRKDAPVVMVVAVTLLATVSSAASAARSCRPDPDGPELDPAVFVAAAASPYILPFEIGTARLVWRTSSHFNPGNRGVGLYAIDFDMPIGTPLVAARAGKVVAVQDRFVDGNDRDLEENFVMIQHDDGSVARYIHLQQGGVLVAQGDDVRQGQRVARSGNSGQTGGPHLHFDVQTCGPNLPPHYNALPCGMTLPLSFRNAGAQVCGLVPGRRYGGQR